MTKLDEIIESSWIRNSYNDVAFDKHSFATALVEALKGAIMADTMLLKSTQERSCRAIDYAFEALNKDNIKPDGAYEQGG